MTKGLDVRLRGALSLLAAAALYGSFGVPIRILGTLFGDSTQVAVRFFIAAMFLGGFILWRGDRAVVRRVLSEHHWRVFSLAGMFSVEAIFFTIAVIRTPLANTIFLLYAGGIITSLIIGTLVWGEPMTLLKAAAIITALVGLGVYAGSFVVFGVGAWAGLAAGVCEGIVNGLRKSLKGADRSTVSMIQYGVGAFVALLIALLTAERLIHVEGDKPMNIIGPLLVALAFAIGLVCVGYLSLYGFGHFDLNVGTILLSTEIGFAPLLGLLFYGEVPGLVVAIGGLLVFAAVTLTVLERPTPSVAAETSVG